VRLFVLWSITFRCNLRCQYCAAFEVRRDELGTDEVLAGLDTLRAIGARWVTSGGGEPLVRKDIGEIVRHARGAGTDFLAATGRGPERDARVQRLIVCCASWVCVCGGACG
jgi:MoaA/NifB/PqqE/SkfB family radical SAM enzyme